MAINLAVNDVLQCRLEYKLNETIAYNVLHYKVLSTSGSVPGMNTALATIATGLFNLFAELWEDSAAAAVTMTGCTVQDVIPAPRSVGVTYTPGTPRPGQVTGDPMPLQDSPTFVKKTDVGQRWGMGRLFYVGIAESLTAGGIITAATVTSLNNFANALASTTTVPGTGWSVQLQPVLLGKQPDGQPRITIIRQCYVSNDILKTQRRRRPGKGI